MKVVIFDIDGTLANLDHRLHHIKDGNRNWDAFHEFAKNDLPVWPIIDLLNALAAQNYLILLVSGRSEHIREDTKNWLKEHGVTYHDLYMRPYKDYRQDTIIKKEILEIIRKDFPEHTIAFVVDDRSSVVKMWRAEGLICLQCAEWEE